jgi:hypothetical protein
MAIARDPGAIVAELNDVLSAFDRIRSTTSARATAAEVQNGQTRGMIREAMHHMSRFRGMPIRK